MILCNMCIYCTVIRVKKKFEFVCLPRLMQKKMWYKMGAHSYKMRKNYVYQVQLFLNKLVYSFRKMYLCSEISFGKMYRLLK
jgi:hypothetical protein